MGDTLNFTVTATQSGNPLVVTDSGLPPGATFDGTNFSWVGAFVDLDDNGYNVVTFNAGGDTTDVVIGVTEFPIVAFALVDDATGQPFPGNTISIPVGGKRRVWAQALCNPFGQGNTPFCGQGTNGWPEFLWSILNPSVAEFVSTNIVSEIKGLAIGMTPVEAVFTDATVGVWPATATVDVQ
jgi:hypothetical protein